MRKFVLSIAAVIVTGAFWIEANPSQAADSKIVVNDEAFQPADITVPSGTTVTVENASQNAPHSAKAQDGSFDTGYIMPGASGTVTMSKAGDFEYFCEPHPWKEGTIHVT